MGSAHTDGDALTIYRCPECGKQRHGYPCLHCGSGLSGEEVRVFTEEDVRPLWEALDAMTWEPLAHRPLAAFPTPKDWRE